MDAYEEVWLANRAMRHGRSIQKPVKVVRAKISGREALSFTWRLAFGVAVVPIAIAACCTVIGLPVGLFLFWVATKPLQNFFTTYTHMKLAAEEAIKQPDKHQQHIDNWVVQYMKG